MGRFRTAGIARMASLGVAVFGGLAVSGVAEEYQPPELPNWRAPAASDPGWFELDGRLPEIVVEDILRIRRECGTELFSDGEVFLPLPLGPGSLATEEHAPPNDERRMAAQLRKLIDCGSAGCRAPAIDPDRHVGPAAFPAAAPVDLLREMARELEEIAHELECQELYHRSDQLRELAAGLRHDARSIRTRQASRP